MDDGENTSVMERAEAYFNSKLAGKPPADRPMALAEAAFNTSIGMTLAEFGSDKPFVAMAATLLWLAADASVQLAATALAALSLFADAETPVVMYLEQTEVLLQPSSSLGKAMRRLDVLDAAAAEKPDTLPLLLAQATQSHYRVSLDPDGVSLAEQQQLRQQVNRGLLWMAPAACRAATAVAAADSLTSQLDVQQIESCTQALCAAIRIRDPRDSVIRISSEDASAAPTLRQAAAAAVQLLDRVSRLCEAAGSGSLPPVAVWPGSDSDSSTECSPVGSPAGNPAGSPVGDIGRSIGRSPIQSPRGSPRGSPGQAQRLADPAAVAASLIDRRGDLLALLGGARKAARHCEQQQQPSNMQRRGQGAPSRQGVLLARADAATAMRIVLRLAAECAVPRPAPDALRTLGGAVNSLVPLALEGLPLADQTAAAAMVADILRAGWAAPGTVAGTVFWLPAAYVLLRVLALIADAAPASTAIAAAAAAAGAATAEADTLQVRLQLPASILLGLLRLCDPSGPGERLMQCKSPVKLMKSDNNEREPEPLRLYATGLAKEAADVLYAATLQLLGAGAAKGPPGVAAALQQLIKHDALQGLQAMLQLPLGVTCSFVRTDLENSEASGVMRAAHALAAAAGAAADLLTNSDERVPNATMAAAGQAAAAVLVAAARLAADGTAMLVGAGGKAVELRQSASALTDDAVRLTATGCEVLATLLPRLQQQQRAASDDTSEVVTAVVAAVAEAVGWVSGLRKVQKATQMEVLTHSCASLAAAAQHPAGRRMLAAGGSADWSKQAVLLQRALAASTWRQLQCSADDVRAAVEKPIRR